MEFSILNRMKTFSFLFTKQFFFVISQPKYCSDGQCFDAQEQMCVGEINQPTGPTTVSTNFKCPSSNGNFACNFCEDCADYFICVNNVAYRSVDGNYIHGFLDRAL